jgi:energy-coupling factor transporter ATP-binding protein EcfA2
MRGLQKVEIIDFKAFEGRVEFDLKGNHLLLYGENGSGKSSLFWALYTFLQSGIKNKDSRKYFDPANPESLVNDFASPANPSISLVFNGNPARTYSLTLAGLAIPAPPDTVVSDANLASDFISHRLLTAFYNFRNSEEINLFPVFLRDIMPFWQTSSGENLGDLYNDILANRPLRISGTRIVNKRSDWLFDLRIKNINDEIEKIINNLNMDLTKFYQENFEVGQTEFEVTLEFVSKLRYEKLQQTRKLGSTVYRHPAYDIKEFTNPIIALRVKRQVNMTSKPVSKPQSYLNEAKLTAIGLSMRFLFLKQRPKKVQDKILALDDLLVSLDMVNREKVMNLLVKEFAKEYQILLLTHDRGFFEYAKAKFSDSASKELLPLEVHVDDTTGHDVPFVTQNKSNIERAQYYFRSKDCRDYGASANYLRKEAERFLETFLPKHWQLNDNLNELDLNAKIAKSISYANLNGFDPAPFIALDSLRRYVFNPHSHYELDYPSFRQELQRAFVVFESLSKLKNNIIVPRQEALTLEIVNGAISHRFVLKLTDDLRLLLEPTKTSWTSRCSFILMCTGPKRFRRKAIKDQSIETFYPFACRIARSTPRPDPFLEFKLADGRELTVLRTY